MQESYYYFAMCYFVCILFPSNTIFIQTVFVWFYSIQWLFKKTFYASLLRFAEKKLSSASSFVRHSNQRKPIRLKCFTNKASIGECCCRWHWLYKTRHVSYELMNSNEWQINLIIKCISRLRFNNHIEYSFKTIKESWNLKVFKVFENSMCHFEDH